MLKTITEENVPEIKIKIKVDFYSERVLFN